MIHEDNFECPITKLVILSTPVKNGDHQKSDERLCLTIPLNAGHQRHNNKQPLKFKDIQRGARGFNNPETM